MSSLKRYSPFDNALEDVFQRAFRPMRFEMEQPQFKMDVTESDKSYLVMAEIPGVKKEDIHVSVHGNLVSINAEIKQEKEVREEGKLIRSERYYGNIYRSFTLDQDVDDGHSEAKYEDGVLKLTLPKKESGGMRKLPIQ